MLTVLFIIARAVHIGASMLLAGIFTFQFIALNPAVRSAGGDFERVRQRLLRLAIWSLVVALLSALFWFWLETANMSGVSLTQAFFTTAWRRVLFQTIFGRVWQVRLALMTVAFAFALGGLAQPGTPQPQRVLTLVLWVVSVVLLVSLAWISHPAAAGVQPLGVLGNAVHLCAAGGWMGGLAPLAIFLAYARTSDSLGDIATPVLERFSTLSLCCVGFLVLGGVSNSWLLVGSIHALLTTRYGWLLLSKLALFGILIGFGARNRLTIKTKLRQASAGPESLRRFRRNVICEVCLGLLIVVIVACLGVMPPARYS
jgi:putative copper resistance protein D